MNRHVISVEVAAKLCGVSRGLGYEEARKPDGAIPTLRLGRRLVVPVSRLAEALGTTPEALSCAIDALEGGADPATQQVNAQVA
jgi:hypothetical protein